jgi:hypothetical protein
LSRRRHHRPSYPGCCLLKEVGTGLVNYQQGAVLAAILLLAIAPEMHQVIAAAILLLVIEMHCQQRGVATGLMWMQQEFINIIHLHLHHQFQRDNWQQILHFYHKQSKPPPPCVWGIQVESAC